MKYIIILIFFSASLLGSPCVIEAEGASVRSARVGSVKIVGKNIKCLSFSAVPVGWVINIKNSGDGEFLLEGNVEYGAAAIKVEAFLGSIVFDKLEESGSVSVYLYMELLDAVVGEFNPSKRFPAELVVKAIKK